MDVIPLQFCQFGYFLKVGILRQVPLMLDLVEPLDNYENLLDQVEI